ncbi:MULTISPECIES: inosine/xanthosine triphosphatase [unclassified Lysinibacillus]|uniref:inosine/xanthosine triphosphatase n=1 Tax=unclassified Lysinibacillus TaxID=2636778 RepID=UPI00380932F4
MKIVLTSKNEAKIKAVTNVFSQVFNNNIEIIPISVDSGISETPINDEEALQGCRTRIDNVKLDDFDYIVSMEGLIQEFSYGSFVYGIVVIWDAANKQEAIGCSAKVKIPEKLAKSIKPEQKLSDLVEKSYSSEKVKELSLIGTNGVITNKLFTRVDEFDGALRSALGYLINKENYS